MYWPKQKRDYSNCHSKQAQMKKRVKLEAFQIKMKI